jgi:CheY-like chemotaxis protein
MSSRTNGEVVLVVEDDPATANALLEFLRLAGHETMAAGNGKEALDILTADPAPTVCLVILDLMMPVMDGWELRSRMLADRRLAALPVIVVTADTNARRRARNAQAVLFLVKPIEPSLLLEAVARHC